nr:ABC transporter permease [Kurthia sibirica]
MMRKSGLLVISALLFLTIWQLIISVGNYPEALLPSPKNVFYAFEKYSSDGLLISHIGISMYRFVLGYSAAAILAILLGLALGRLTLLWGILDPIVQLLRPVSPIAWSPFIVLWFGIGNMPAIVIIFIAAFFPVLLSTITAVKRVDPLYLKVAANLELSNVQLIGKIIFPAAFPAIAGGLHLALGSAWVFLVAGEMVGAQSGLGYLIVDARNSLSLDVVMMAILTIGIIGFILDRIIHFAEKWVVHKYFSA